MRRLSVQIIIGALLLVAGALLLLEATGVMSSPRILWAVLLAGASAAFWYVFATSRHSWWAAIPGAALAGAAVVMLMELDPEGIGQWTEVPFLAALGLGFWAVYLRNTARWWAVIPGGALLTLSAVTGVAGSAGGPATGAVFLFGLAATFVLVAVLPGGRSRRWWAWIPAAALAVVATLVLADAAEWYVALNYIWPLAVIGAGAFLIWRAVRRGRHPEERGPASTDGTASTTSSS